MGVTLDEIVNRDTLLVEGREVLLASVFTGGVPDDVFFRLVSGMADTVVPRGYVFEEKRDEAIAVAHICKVITTLEPIVQKKMLMILACYRPIREVLNAGQIEALQPLRSDPLMDDFFKRYIDDGEVEDPAVIESISELRGSVSAEVASRYNRDPFPPAYAYLRLGERTDFGLRDIMGADFPALRDEEGIPHEFSSIELGCGRGPSLNEAAHRFPAGSFLGVDLSQASLAMARRDARKNGITNARFMQGDLLGLADYPEQFDLLVCGGVLHHLPERREAWKILTDLVKPGGFMQIGVYSVQARKSFNAVKGKIVEWGFTDSLEDLRKVRKRIMEAALSGDRACARVITCPDFDYRAGLRDLLFHNHEYPYTLPELKALIDEQDLEFLGFRFASAHKEIMAVYNVFFPEDPNGLNLENWAFFEGRFPQTFVSMYNFCLRKKV